MIFESNPWVMVDIVIRHTNKSRSPAFSVIFTQQLPMYIDIADNTVYSSHDYNYIKGNTSDLVINGDIVDLESSINVLYYATISKYAPNDILLSINSTLCYQSLPPQSIVLQV